MFGITDLASYLIGVIIIIILPGPNSLYCLTTAASQGKAAGAKAMAGILVGDTLLIIATVLGAGTLLRLYPDVFDALKLLGGLYLTYLGVRLMMAAYQAFVTRHRSIKDVQKLIKPSQDHHPFYRSLSLSLTNPKAILFFLSFFVQFADPNYPKPYVTFLVLAVILQLVSFLYLSLLVVGGNRLAQGFGRYVWLKILGNLGVGLLFVGFGVQLWLSQL